MSSTRPNACTAFYRPLQAPGFQAGRLAELAGCWRELLLCSARPVEAGRRAACVLLAGTSRGASSGSRAWSTLPLLPLLLPGLHPWHGMGGWGARSSCVCSCGRLVHARHVQGWARMERHGVDQRLRCASSQVVPAGMPMHICIQVGTLPAVQARQPDEQAPARQGQACAGCAVLSQTWPTSTVRSMMPAHAVNMRVGSRDA